jgi:hypothetical protein
MWLYLAVFRAHFILEQHNLFVESDLSFDNVWPMASYNSTETDRPRLLLLVGRDYALSTMSLEH